MSKFVHRGRRLAAKFARRGRRLVDALAKPSEVELLMAKLPAVESAGELRDKVVIITGSTRGVGLAVAQAFAKEGARIVVNGRGQEAVDKVVAGIRGGGGVATGVCVDITAASGPEALLDGALDAFGRVDILINNAAVIRPIGKKAWQASAADVLETIQVNLVAPYLCAAKVIDWMIANRTPGRVINVSSGAGETPAPNLAAYGVSKFGLEGLTKYLAVDLDRSGIAVATVQLGSLKTDLTQAAFKWEDAEMLPPPESAVPVFVYLATAPSAHVHGRVVAAWRFLSDQFAETMLGSAAAVAPVFNYPELEYDGHPVERDSTEITNFDRQENQFGASPKAVEAITATLARRSLAIYPDDRYRRLHAALARHYDLPEACFVVGNGSWEVINRLLKLFVKPGEEVLSNLPGWFGFDMLCARYNLANVQVPFELAGPANRAHHNLSGILERIGPQTRMIYLISPSNPEGVPIPKSEFLAFLAEVPPHLPVLVDEAYAEFANDPDMLQAPEVVLDTDRTVVALRTFSKFYGLGALRVGYGIAKPEVANLMERMGLIFNVSHLSEVAAVAALEDTDFQRHVRDRTNEERARIERRADELGLSRIPSQAPFILLECPCHYEKFWKRYESEGIFLSRSLFYEGKYAFFPVATAEQNTRNLEILSTLV